MNVRTLVCAWCPLEAIGVVPRDHHNDTVRGLPVCEGHFKDLVDPSPDGFRYVQMFGALRPGYLEGKPVEEQAVLW